MTQESGDDSGVRRYGQEAPAIVLTVPMTPPRACSPNARVHFRTRATAARTLHTAAAVATAGALRIDPVAAGALAAAPRICYRLEVSWEPGRRGTVDEDNTLASAKALLDGVARALGVDDRRFRVRGVEIDRTTRRGVTVVTLWPEEEEP